MIIQYEAPASLLELRKYDLIFFSTPYTKYPTGIFQAHRDACKIAGRLLEQQLHIYSPIAESHPVAIHSELNPVDHDFWMVRNRPFMRKCDALLIGKLKSWDISRGILEEAKYFLAQGRPVHFLNHATLVVDDNYERDKSALLDVYA